MNPKHINDLTELYAKPVIGNKDGSFKCPVCLKDYQTRVGIMKHMEAKECASAVSLFTGTITEEIGYKFYSEVCHHYANRAPMKTSTFRKNKAYKPVLRFILHCMTNKTDPYLYFFFLQSMCGKHRFITIPLSAGLKDTSLKAFRVHLMRNEELIESEKFFNSNEANFNADPSFVVRAVQRGDIGMMWLINNFNLVEKASNYPEAIRIALIKVLDLIENP